MIEPTVGRQVWYQPSEKDKRGAAAMQQALGQPLAATVVCVHNERLVTLAVYDSGAHLHRRPLVTLVQPGDALPPADSAFAQWMPFQLAQAQPISIVGTLAVEGVTATQKPDIADGAPAGEAPAGEAPAPAGETKPASTRGKKHPHAAASDPAHGDQHA